MKNKNYLLALLLIVPVLFSTCTKMGKTSFTMTAFYDSTVTSGNVVSYSLQTSESSNERIKISIEGLPAYITADYTEYLTQLPSKGAIYFRFNSLSDGNVSLWHYYTVTIKATSESNVVRKATVTFYCAPSNAMNAFQGHIFDDHEACASSGSDGRTVTTSYVSGDTVWLQGFYQTLTTVYSVPAIVNGRTRTLTLLNYSTSPFIFRGSGTFYATGNDSIACVIHYSRSTSSTFDTCTSTLTTLY